MNQLRDIEGKRKERYSDIRQAELAMLCTVYKTALLIALPVVVCLLFNLGWRARQSDAQQQRISQLEQVANDAQWELGEHLKKLEPSQPSEGVMRAIHLLEGALE